ncbi:MAG TPA: class I SAM-dependent methyltransferase [Candidatus Acidoferrum sp.]|nr:class I SAM-dependent methyltransferase [Candidatus Acidoferrum sp.]
MKARSILTVLFAVVALPCRSQTPPKATFVSLTEAQPSLAVYGDALPEELRRTKPLDEAGWAKWIQQSDQEVRKRLIQGQEDTLSNLLRFGVTYTKEYRIDDEYLPKYGESSLVNSFAENRANDLVKALASPQAKEGFREMRGFVEKQGYSFQTPAERLRVKKYLLANLARLREDFLKARSEEARENRWQAFEQRGISLDTNLWPDYSVDAHLRALLEKGVLKPSSIRKVAVVGPGLDFVNKQEGYDFYPPQTIQPFAVLDTLFRLKLADPATAELYTLDISSDVNLHIERIRKEAAAGKPYVLELPWYSAGRWTEEFRAKFVSYWESLGSAIGQPVSAVKVPEGAGGIDIRAIEVRPAVVKRVTPLDLNIVYQRLDLAPEERFDLIIGTNVFIYYGAFEQSLVRLNVARMLRPGGFLLSSEKLADRIENGLATDLTTEITMTGPPVMTDYIFGYRRN